MLIVPPPEIILDEIRERQWSVDDLAERMNMPAQAVRDVLASKSGITFAIAEALATAFGTSIALWLNLQAAYDEAIKQQRNGEQ